MTRKRTLMEIDDSGRRENRGETVSFRLSDLSTASQSRTHSCILSHSCGSREFWEFPLPISSGRGDSDDKHCVTVVLLNKLERWVIGKTEKDQSLKSEKKKTANAIFSSGGTGDRWTDENFPISPGANFTQTSTSGSSLEKFSHSNTSNKTSNIYIYTVNLSFHLSA